MKIAYIGIKGLPSKGGAERAVEAIAQRLSGRHELTVYCSSRYTPLQATVSGIRLIRLPCLLGKHVHMTSVDFLAAWHAVLFGNYDLIHLHNIEASFVLPILKLRYRVVATAHGRIKPGNKWGKISAAIMRFMELPFGIMSDAMTSVSLNHAQKISSRFRRPVSYIPNGVDHEAKLDTEIARPVLEKNHLPVHEYLLFVAGRIIPLKGAHLLLNAFKKIQDNIPLVIVGDLRQLPEYANSLKALADSRTHLIPFLHSPSALLGLMKLSRLFVFPSTDEAMSMVLLEAASMGVPILCSDIPANMAILPEQSLSFRSSDVDDLAAKLRWALEHPAEMDRLGQEAQSWVRTRFSWDLIAEQYDQLYHQFV